MSGQIICYSCNGTGVFSKVPMTPGGTTPAKPGSGEAIQCTSCLGKGVENTFYPG